MRAWRVVLVLTIILLPVLGQAGQLSFEYGTTPRIIRACVLLVPGAPGGTDYANPNPYLLPMLARSAVRPGGWTFINPLAPTSITSGDTVWTLWATAGHAPQSGANYWSNRGLVAGSALLSAVPREWPQYWEVTLNDNLGDGLTQFDLIYVTNPTGLNVATPRQMAALQRAVENGAVLWVDNTKLASPPMTVTSFPVPRISTAVPFAFQAVAGTFTSRALDAAHPLLRTPFMLSLSEIDSLGSGPSAGSFYYLVGNALDDTPLQPVVDLTTSGGGGTEIAATPYGQGAIVVTAEGVGQQVGNWYSSGMLEPTPANQANFKLAYNITNLAHTWGQVQDGPGNHGQSFTQARAPLDLLWQFPAPWDNASTLPQAPGPIAGGPVISDGRLFVLSTVGPASATSTLWCLSTAPTGADGYTILWSADLGANFSTRASSPTGCLINGVPAVVVSAVNTQTGRGMVTAFNAVTGDVIWNTALPVRDTDTLVDLSTPVVFKNWIFLLATDYDSNLMGGGTQGSHGTVYVLDLASGGGATTWLYPDSLRGDNRKLLPPFHDPTWVSTPGRSELPPDGDNHPAVCTSLRTAFGLPVEAALIFHAPAQLSFAGGNINTSATNGEEYAFVPTPVNGSGAALLNADYYSVRLANSDATAITSPAPRYNPGEPLHQAQVNATPRPAPDGGSLAWFNSAGYATNVGVLKLLNTLGIAPYDSPLTLRQGCNVAISYTRTGTPSSITSEQHFLPGPVAWVRQINGQGTAEYSGRTLVAGSQLTLLDSETASLIGQFSTATDTPPGLTAATPSINPAMDAETTLAAVNLAGGTTEQAGVIALRAKPDFTVHLGPGLADTLSVARDSVTVTQLDSASVIPASNYTVDLPNRVLRFDPASGVSGKAILVTWTDTAATAHTAEPHVIPAATRFSYIGGFLKLHYYPVVAGSIAVVTPSGSTVAGGAAETTAAATFGGNPVLPNGWLDLRQAFVTDAASVNHGLVGKEVLVSYRGWSEADQRYLTVSNAAGADYPAEEQQVPYEMGPVQSGVAFTGQAAVIPAGPLNFPIGDASGPNRYPPLYSDETLLSLLWDPVSNRVKGFLSRPSVTLQSGTSVSLTGSPAAFADKVYVGTAQTPAGGAIGSLGCVGCLGPRHTLICDGNRIVESVGAEHTWTLTGSKAYVWGRTAPEPELSTPFNQPAKAAALSGDTYLVVDTGNNRVVEVDRTGNQVWPLDEGLDTGGPCDYYSSPQRTVSVGGTPTVTGNNNLKLEQPADAYRYFAAGVQHSLIADTGNNRVLDVATTGSASGAQAHVVTQVTPEFVRPPWDPTHPLKLRYTRAQPIFDFGNGNLIGYLCAATNIDRVVIVEANTLYVDPAPTSTPPGGSRPWSDWSWLYNLQFDNLRHVEYFRYGTTAYVAVAAGGLSGSGQDGVWVWEINTTSGPVAGAGPAGATFAYTGANFAAAGAFSTLHTPYGTNYQRAFYPVCAKVLYPGLLYGGNVLITNYTGLIENLVRPNVGSPGTELHGEVFEVDPTQADNQKIVEGRTIPDPWQMDWNDPLNQPAYAERY